MLEAFGHGYGFDLFGLAPEEVRAGQDEEIRTPHSVFFYALGHTGWVGVGLFAVLQITILRLLWRAFRLSGQPAGVVFWVMGMSMACFEQSFDTPYRAIPFYLLVGMAMAPALQPVRELHPLCAARMPSFTAR
jgi:O-antigen ligase